MNRYHKFGDVADFTLGWQEALKDARKKWIGGKSFARIVKEAEKEVGQ